MRFISVAAMAAVTILSFAACGNTGAAPAATATAKVPGGATAAPGAATPTAATAPPVPATTAPTPTPAPVGSTVDVCALLSVAELEAAISKEYLPGLPDDYGQCFWDGDQMQNSNPGFTIVGAVNERELSFIKDAFGQGGVDATVNGHAAFWNPRQGLGSMWVDIGGGRLFVLSFPMSKDLDPSFKAIAQKLSEIAVAKIAG